MENNELPIIEFGFGNVKLCLSGSTVYCGAYGEYKLKITNDSVFSHYFIKDEQLQKEKLRSLTIDVIRKYCKDAFTNIFGSFSVIEEINDNKESFENDIITKLVKKKDFLKLGFEIETVRISEFHFRACDDKSFIILPKNYKKKRTLPILILSIMVCALVLGITVFALSNNDEPKLNNSEFADGVKVEYEIVDDGVKLNSIRMDYYVDELVIPSSYKGYPIKTIGEYIIGDQKIGSLVISEGIESLDESTFIFSNIDYLYLPSTLNDINLTQNAFRHNNFKKFYIDSHNETYKTDETGKYILSKDGKELFAYANGNTDDYPEIPNGVEVIHNQVFSGAKFKNIRIPNGVITMSWSIFLNSGFVENVYIPESVKHIDGACFADMNNLKNVEIDENNSYYFAKDGIVFSCENDLIVIPRIKTERNYTIPLCKSIGFGSMIGNRQIVNLEIGDGISEIRGQAFIQCTNIKTVYIPDSVKIFGEAIFEYDRKREYPKSIMGSENSNAESISNENRYVYLETEIRDGTMYIVDYNLNGNNIVWVPEKVGDYPVIVEENVLKEIDSMIVFSD